MKKKYSAPQAEVMAFEPKDVITASFTQRESGGLEDYSDWII